MNRNTFRGMTHSGIVVLLLAVAGVGQSPPKTAADPVGVVATEARSVKVQGSHAQRGSTVFNGEEIQTSDDPVTVDVTSGGGALVIAPKSRVKLSRESSRVVAEVLKGTVTIRSPLSSTVITRDRIIQSEPENLYRVTISDSGTGVESFMKSVTVKAASGALETIVAQAGGLKAAGPQQGPNDGEPVTPVKGPFLTANCTLSGTTLTVFGVVTCRGVAIAGADVVLWITVPGGFSINKTTKTDGTGRYEFILTDDRLARGGISRLTVQTNRHGCVHIQNACNF